MKTYEGLFIIEPNAASERFDHVQTTLAQEIEQRGGTITTSEELGQRSLCYPIKKKTEGFYHLITFMIDAKALNEVRERLHKMPDILRFLVTVPPELSEKKERKPRVMPVSAPELQGE